MTTPADRRPARVAPLPVRAWFGLIGHIAPRLAERQAARLFLTPRHRKDATPTDLHPLLLPSRTRERGEGEGAPSYVELSTGRIPLWSWGTGPTVLLIHGWSGSAADMAAIAAALVEGGYRAVLFDMPGHGSAAPAPANLLVYLRTVAALRDLLGPIHTIVGHSLGGTTTALALGQRLIQAERAVLVAPGLSPWEFSRLFAKSIGLPLSRLPGMIVRTEEAVGAKADSLNAAEAVRELTLPARILHDPDDLDVPFDHSVRLAAAWKGSELIPRPGLGHRRILKDPRTIAQVVQFVVGQGSPHPRP